MSEVVTAVDTSVIIPAVLSWHEHHVAAFPAIRDGLAGAVPLLLPLPAVLEAYSVLTRLPPPWRIAPGQARELLATTFRARARVVALDGDAAWTLVDGLAGAGIGAGATYDAHILACAERGGATRLLTFNLRHFERFRSPILVATP